jgi:hypothetical protein
MKVTHCRWRSLHRTRTGAAVSWMQNVAVPVKGEFLVRPDIPHHLYHKTRGLVHPHELGPQK